MKLVKIAALSGSHRPSSYECYVSRYPQTRLDVTCSFVRLQSLCIYFVNHFFPACCSFVWAMTTLVLNRSLLHVRRVEVIEAFVTERLRAGSSEAFNRSASPFGLPPEDLDNWDLEEEIQERELKLPSGMLEGGTPLVVELNNFIPWHKRKDYEKAADSRTFFFF
jgi:hypothetical protein